MRSGIARENFAATALIPLPAEAVDAMMRSPVLARRSLTRSAITLTELGFGGAPIGNLYEPVDEDAAADTVHTAVAQGIDYFDTAPFYGLGVSEARLGRALAGRATLSTKVGRVLVDSQSCDGIHQSTAVFDYSAAGVVQSVEMSLQRLQRDRFDIVLVHDVGRETHGTDHAAVMAMLVKETLPELRRLQATGLIGAIGIGVNEIAVCLETLDVADIDIVMVSGRYTLLEQAAADILLPRCLERRIGVVIGGAFNSGILAQREAPGKTFNYAPVPPDILARAQNIYRIAANHGVDVGAAALQFPLAHPAVLSVIPGARSSQEVIDNVVRYHAPIPEGFWRDLRDGGHIAANAPLPA